MKNVLILLTLLLTSSIYQTAFSQTSKLDFELVPKDELKQWVDNYGFSKLDALAKGGDAVAQRRLARYYLNSVDDYVRAFKWNRKAAENGDYYAQYDLGYQYHLAIGTSLNYIEAKKWYKKSANQGFGPAKDAFQEMREILGGIVAEDVIEVVEDEAEIEETSYDNEVVSVEEVDVEKEVLLREPNFNNMTFREMINWINDNKENIYKSDPRYSNIKGVVNMLGDKLKFDFTENNITKEIKIDLGRLTFVKRHNLRTIELGGKNAISVQTKNDSDSFKYLDSYMLETNNPILNVSLSNIFYKTVSQNKNFERKNVDIDKYYTKKYIVTNDNDVFSSLKSKQNNTFGTLELSTFGGEEGIEIIVKYLETTLSIQVPISQITQLIDDGKSLGIYTKSDLIKVKNRKDGKIVGIWSYIALKYKSISSSKKYSMYLALRNYIIKYRNEYKEKYGRGSVPDFEFNTVMMAF